MNESDRMMQELYETLDHIPVGLSDRRRRSIDLVLAARKAERARDPYSAEKNYMRAADELRGASNDRAHRAVERIEKEAHRLRNHGVDRQR